MRAILLATVAAGLGGCVSAPENAPEWANGRGYPSLREVPRETIANTDAEYWAAIEVDLREAGAAVRSNPRSAPASATESPEAFLSEAMAEIEAARLAHEPN